MDRAFAAIDILIDVYVLYFVFRFWWFGEPLDARMGFLLMLVVLEALCRAIIKQFRGREA